MLKDLIVNDGSILKITSSPGLLEVVFEDWKEAKWVLSIDELIAFESLGAEGETLGELLVEENNDYKKKVISLLPDEAEIETCVYVFRSAWSGLPVLQVIGRELKVTPLAEQ